MHRGRGQSVSSLKETSLQTYVIDDKNVPQKIKKTLKNVKNVTEIKKKRL